MKGINSLLNLKLILIRRSLVEELLTLLSRKISCYNMGSKLKRSWIKLGLNKYLKIRINTHSNPK